jgi:hypothetical protein
MSHTGLSYNKLVKRKRDWGLGGHEPRHKVLIIKTAARAVLAPHQICSECLAVRTVSYTFKM